MTFVLPLATPLYVSQVTDRLVTFAGKPYDPLANKNVLYCARDGVVAIGYSGAADVDDRPTDEWIARILGRLADDDIGTVSLRASGVKGLMNLGRSVDLLRRACEAAFPAPGAEERDPQIVVAAGLPRIRLHDLRHSWASLFASWGGAPT